MLTYQEKLNYYDRAIEACRWVGDLVSICVLRTQKTTLEATYRSTPVVQGEDDETS